MSKKKTARTPSAWAENAAILNERLGNGETIPIQAIYTNTLYAISTALTAIALQMTQEDAEPAEASESYTRADMARAWAEGSVHGWLSAGGETDACRARVDFYTNEKWGRIANPYARPAVQDPSVDDDKPAGGRVLTGRERFAISNLLLDATEEQLEYACCPPLSASEAVDLAALIPAGRVTITEEES